MDTPNAAGAPPSARKRRRIVSLVSAGAVSGLVVAYLIGCWSIASGVESISSQALRESPGDPVVALLAYVKSDEHPLEKRDRAVWALGQLGDPRALPHLVQLHTGEPCDHESGLCQRGLAKAIRGCRGATNITAWIWR